MIVVVGSRHDPIATGLVDQWPGAALCGAEDLTVPGWAWSPTGAADPRWVVGGRTVPDHDVTGVFVCRRAFYPEEFADTHPDDRTYLAAESHAFLADVLASTSAFVPQPFGDGTFGDELVRPDRWSAAAEAEGLRTRAIRLRSNGAPPTPEPVRTVEVVGETPIGTATEATLAAVVGLAARLGVSWITVTLDESERVLAVTTSAPPSSTACAALGQLLAGRSS